jgi:hypothetical protein
MRFPSLPWCGRWNQREGEMVPELLRLTWARGKEAAGRRLCERARSEAETTEGAVEAGKPACRDRRPA